MVRGQDSDRPGSCISNPRQGIGILRLFDSLDQRRGLVEQGFIDVSKDLAKEVFIYT